VIVGVKIDPDLVAVRYLSELPRRERVQPWRRTARIPGRLKSPKESRAPLFRSFIIKGRAPKKLKFARRDDRPQQIRCGSFNMRNLLLTVMLGVVVAGYQTGAMAQPAGGGAAEGSRAYCEARWNATAGAHTESYDAFMNKCLSCRARWDDMVASNTTAGQNRSAYLRKCSKGAYWTGGWTPAIGLLALAGGITAIAVSSSGGHPASP
jgi:hypothetical protein